jgi:hypothetical protein
MTTNLDYETAHKAIEDFKAGKFSDIVAAAEEHGANIQIINIMIGNENVVTEETFIDDDVRRMRLSTCNSCDQLAPEGGGTCMQCACPKIILVNMEFKSCPIGKW